MKLQSLLGEMRIVDIPFDAPEEPPALPAPAATPAAKPKPKKPAQLVAPSAVVSAASTAVAPAHRAQVPVAGGNDDLAMSRLRDLMANVPDDEDDPVAMEPKPAIDNGKAVVRVGDQTPEWTRVGDLPMYILGPIRKLAKELFASYTTTPLERIEVIANYGGSGPNSDQEIDAVAKWITDSGELLSSDTVDFDNVMPGYKAQTRLFDVDDREYLLVKDDHGKYIYSWSGTAELSQDKQQKVLK